MVARDDVETNPSGLSPVRTRSRQSLSLQLRQEIRCQHNMANRAKSRTSKRVRRVPPLASANMLCIRLATTPDVPTIAHHRVQMFADMKVLPWHLRERLFRETSQYLERAIPSGKYVGWLASVRERPYEIVAGAGVQLRPVLPHPVKRCGRVVLTGGVQALVLNVFTAPAWRRRGVARLANG